MGVLVAILTQVAKKMPVVPINEGNTYLLRALAALLSVAGVVLVHYSNGTFAHVDWANIGLESVVTYFMSYLAYAGVIKPGAKVIS